MDAKRILFTVTSLLLATTPEVHADLGLNITVPDLSTRVTTSVGEGIVPLIIANGTISSEARLDGSGTIATLISVVNKVVSPLNVFLGRTLAAARDSEGESEQIFASLSETANASRSSIGDAVIMATALEKLIRPSIYGKIIASLLDMRGNIENARLAIEELSFAVDEVKNSVEPIVSDNITTIVTPELIDNLTVPLKNITSDISDLATLCSVIIKDKTKAIGYHSDVNTTFKSTQGFFDTFFVSGFNRSYADAINGIAGLAKTYVTNLRQSYVTIGFQQLVLGDQNITTMNDYLDTVESSSQYFSQRANETLTMFRENVAQIINIEGGQFILETVHNASKNITDAATKSESAFGERCVMAANGQLSQGPVSVNRLVNCIQGENPGAQALVQVVRGLLDQSRQSASSNGNVLRTCQQLGSFCSNSYFSAYSDLSDQTDAQLVLINNLIAAETKAIANRIRICVVATTADILDNARQILNKFNSCLDSGTY